MTSTEPLPAAPPAAGAHRTPDDLLAEFVRARVNVLQRAYLNRESHALASLARLRRAITSSAGSRPEVWQETLGEFPESLVGRGEAPSEFESAAHQAITLFALHQQSGTQGAHRKGGTIGRAARQLARGASSESAVFRRFQALATASSEDELLHHLRGFITQLRSASISLDYGQLSVDLRRLRHPRLADRVRLRWGRDYHRTTADTSTTTTDTTGASND